MKFQLRLPAGTSGEKKHPSCLPTLCQAYSWWTKILNAWALPPPINSLSIIGVVLRARNTYIIRIIQLLLSGGSTQTIPSLQVRRVTQDFIHQQHYHQKSPPGTSDPPRSPGSDFQVHGSPQPTHTFSTWNMNLGVINTILVGYTIFPTRPSIPSYIPMHRQLPFHFPCAFPFG